MASAVYNGDPIALPVKVFLARMLKVNDPKLKRSVKTLLADNANPRALQALERWCMRHFPDDPAIHDLIPPPTADPPPTATTRGT